MRTLAALFAVILGSTAMASEPASPDAPASLRFVSQGNALDGSVFGIHAVDNQMLPFGQKRSLEFSAGHRVVHYTCPGGALDEAGSELSFDFEAGQQYELVCSISAPAVIRPTGC